MIYSLNELLQKDTSLSIISYINEQISKLLGYPLSEKNKIYELSCTTHFFVNIDEKLNVLGIIVISCKSFLFDERIFFVEVLASKDNNQLVEQSLLLKGINNIANISNDSKLVSFITDERIQKDVLTPFGFVHSQGIMVKI
tara:strand:+ start:34 stop:456 length:423 start_codon:yes stop_codon:yes gene_type:complete